MNNLLRTLNDFLEAWKRLRAARPAETDMSGWIPGLTAEGFERTLNAWISTVRLANGVTRTSPSLDSFSEAMVVGLLRDAMNHINNAQSNGVPWLIGVGQFRDNVAKVAILIETLTGRRISVQRALAKLVENRLNDDIQSVTKAALYAREIIAGQDDVEHQVEVLGKAISQCEESKKALNVLRSESDEDREEILSLRGQIEGEHAKVNQLTSEVEHALEDAKKLLEDVRAQKADADSSVAAGSKTLKETNDRLIEALRDINKQALAGAFHEKAKAVGRERWIWAAIFAAAIVWLALVGWITKTSLIKNNLVDPLALLQGALLASPAVWLGWYASKQSSMLLKIKHDYDYKTATAYAFQGYKKEAAMTDDGSLTKDLLETAIQSFGENPIRLYHNQKDDHGHPIESLLSNIKEPETVKKLVDLLSGLKK